jgi:hypothetical protein
VQRAHYANLERRGKSIKRPKLRGSHHIDGNHRLNSDICAAVDEVDQDRRKYALMAISCTILRLDSVMVRRFVNVLVGCG